MTILLAALPGLGAAPVYLSAREITIEFRTQASADTAESELWVSADSGRTWSRTEAARTAPHTLKYVAPTDGRYDFYLILRSAAGPSGEPPRPGSPPVASVVVDTLPPLLQIHATRVEAAGGRRTVVLDVSLVEEHLSETAVRMFYRTTGDLWRDGGPAETATGTVTWQPPPDLSSPIDLRLVVTDLAGNQATDEVHGVSLPPVETQVSEGAGRQNAPTSQPAAEQRGVAPVMIDPVKAVTLEPAGTRSETQPVASQPAMSPAQRAELRRLRELAAGFLSSGSYSLAAARLEDALRLAPGDADTLAELGRVLVQLGRYDEADARFADAVRLRPDHLAALDGLALVDAARRRYADARVHLQELLRLHPESGTHWLRFGDMAHRVGNSGEALDAWERVLTIPGVDEELRAKARRRLEYFGRPTRQP